ILCLLREFSSSQMNGSNGNDAILKQLGSFSDLHDALKEREEELELLRDSQRKHPRKTMDQGSSPLMKLESNVDASLPLTWPKLLSPKKTISQACSPMVNALSEADDTVTFARPSLAVPAKDKVKKRKTNLETIGETKVPRYSPSEFDSDGAVSDDDCTADPDWVHTPLGKLIRKNRMYSHEIPRSSDMSIRCSCPMQESLKVAAALLDARNATARAGRTTGNAVTPANAAIVSTECNLCCRKINRGERSRLTVVWRRYESAVSFAEDDASLERHVIAADSVEDNECGAQPILVFAMPKPTSDSIKVAVRVRPLVEKETTEGCKQAVFVNQNQVLIYSAKKAFAYNFAFDPTAGQSYIYDCCVRPMIPNLFKGYNVTIFAYGQTGSGKTYTMGTDFRNSTSDDAGIIPRAVEEIFSTIDSSEDSENTTVRVSFIELYKEKLQDLLSEQGNSPLDIREAATGGAYIPNLSESTVTSLDETLVLLKQGGLRRVTGATAMNMQSSRSHAIFTVVIKSIVSENGQKEERTGKFHLVDLAGSENAKKTHATGERFEEGKKINLGLLALRNVLTGHCSKKEYINYRDSKLTRLLQDSLGGNSKTLMIACVSPADSNLSETTSTLSYAEIAQLIQNKPVINRDPRAAEIAELRQQLSQLQARLLAGQGGQSSEELQECQALVRKLKSENAFLKTHLHSALDEARILYEKSMLAESGLVRMRRKIEELKDRMCQAQISFNNSFLDGSIVMPANVSQETLQSHKLKLEEIYQQVIAIQHDEDECAKERLNQERSLRLPVCEASSKEAVDGHAEVVESEYNEEEGLMQRAKLQTDLHNLDEELLEKEDLVQKLTANMAKVAELQMQYQEVEQKLLSLESEKQQLEAEQKESHKKIQVQKIAEERRRRIMELELELKEMRKKKRDHEQILKLKQKQEEQLVKLTNEIQVVQFSDNSLGNLLTSTGFTEPSCVLQVMKQTRVKLMKQMQEASNQFRKWKVEKEREIHKLKEQDRKREAATVRMKQQHAREQDALRQRMERTQALNRRLKETLNKQCEVAKTRSVLMAQKAANRPQAMSAWIQQELDLAAGNKEAQLAIKELMDDRSEIVNRLRALREQYAGESDKEKQVVLQKEITELEEVLEMRQAQITNLQENVFSKEEGSASWDGITSLHHAREALNCLFQAATDAKAVGGFREVELKRLQSENDDMKTRMKDLEESWEAEKQRLERKLTHYQRQKEEQMPKPNGVFILVN
ncbi:unnamed protein product, partial [Darwinula stevensoni]